MPPAVKRRQRRANRGARRGTRLAPMHQIPLNYAAKSDVRKWPVVTIIAQLLTPLFAALLAWLISNYLHASWELSGSTTYPNRSQILQHLRLAEDVPFFVGISLLLLITVTGIVQARRRGRTWLPVVVCAPLGFIGIQLAILLAVPYY
jgi:hypothetical protein